jgi:hypothetical protein
MPCIFKEPCTECDYFKCTCNWDDCEEGKCHFEESELGKSVQSLLDAFSGSFINEQGEFIAHEKSNQYIILNNCKTPFDIQCKVIEWFSRPAHKTAPYVQEWRNRNFHHFMLTGINTFLGKNFQRFPDHVAPHAVLLGQIPLGRQFLIGSPFPRFDFLGHLFRNGNI